MDYIVDGAHGSFQMSGISNRRKQLGEIAGSLSFLPRNAQETHRGTLLTMMNNWVKREEKWRRVKEVLCPGRRDLMLLGRCTM
jgi:hypothetical protein